MLLGEETPEGAEFSLGERLIGDLGEGVGLTSPESVADALLAIRFSF